MDRPATKLFFVFLVVNKLLYWLRAPHAMPPSITFLVLFGIKYGDWLDSSGDYTVRTWVAPVFTLCSDINIILLLFQSRQTTLLLIWI